MLRKKKVIHLKNDDLIPSLIVTFIPQINRNGDKKGVRENSCRIWQAMYLQYSGTDNGRRDIAEAVRDERLHLEERARRRGATFRPIRVASG